MTRPSATIRRQVACTAPRASSTFTARFAARIAGRSSRTAEMAASTSMVVSCRSSTTTRPPATTHRTSRARDAGVDGRGHGVVRRGQRRRGCVEHDEVGAGADPRSSRSPGRRRRWRRQSSPSPARRRRTRCPARARARERVRGEAHRHPRVEVVGRSRAVRAEGDRDPGSEEVRDRREPAGQLLVGRGAVADRRPCRRHHLDVVGGEVDAMGEHRAGSEELGVAQHLDRS